ncbi:Superfamily II DNA or RNA helicase [Butyrivibrio sp. Su6]|uniref:DEAD/DEAH box helicase family protein n=1 Tax=Butyrivibrio sp. Su6 TaxID=1520810 RepID=UPI00089F13B3|nr:DEAD/DEAH box helicase family protein [Butyrivibrio sp. Su6]SEF62126.1 Superfamily II DNA or RNA helicase [Butyrivibrio sp. Su6]
MSFKELDIHNSYKSKGDNSITDAFVVPVLKMSTEYKRSVGFFSSGVIDTISEGIMGLVKNKGIIKLIASPELTEDDIRAITTGYEQRKLLVENRFTEGFVNEIEKLNDRKLQLLSDLIKNNILDIKIAITSGNGIYHDKLGVFTDDEGNKIAFYGSANSSYSGYKGNYEKIRVAKSWVPGFDEIVAEENEEFDQLWNNSNEYVEVYEFRETAQKKLLEVIERRSSGNAGKAVVLRDYQEQAINAWVSNGYHGFYVMATGTGKTWTAIYSAKELIENNHILTVVCAPYKHLIKQWAEDVEKAFPHAKLVLVSSENPEWERQITDEIIRSKYDDKAQLIILSTIASFKKDRFNNLISKFEGKKLLIVDEAHRFTIRPQNYDYLLGLSATPFSGTSAERGKELMDYFGGQVFSLPIEEALDRKYLVPYYYRPIFVHSTDEEESKFNACSRIILSCFKNGKCINPDLLVKTLRNRLRIISMASQKMEQIHDIIDEVKETDHVVVYCGDGHLFDYERGAEVRHIQEIKKILSEHEYKASQFTAQENMKDRMELVDSFNKGEISALAAIRCLDEGINIPSIKSALILSSNDDYREFVQRRGRILRTYAGKKDATIYDVIVLPSRECDQWAKIELRRYLEYARLSLNWDELEMDLEDYLLQYDLSIEDIDVYDYEDVEVDEDE